MPFEYKMSPKMKKILLAKKEKDFKGTDQQYLCKYVNDELGIKGNCVRVIFS